MRTGRRFVASARALCSWGARGAEALRLIPCQDELSPQSVRPLPGLTLLRHYRRNDFEATLYEPVVCLIVQGRKETTLARHNVAVGAGDVLLISHDLPVLSHVTEAPYLSLLLKLELGTLRSLYDEVAETGLDPTRARALEVHRADPQLIEALRRYLALVPPSRDLANASDRPWLQADRVHWASLGSMHVAEGGPQPQELIGRVPRLVD